jgi:hypothetical protein
MILLSSIFYLKNCYQALGNLIRDVYPDCGYFSIPDPGVKKHWIPDPGSAALGPILRISRVKRLPTLSPAW